MRRFSFVPLSLNVSLALVLVLLVALASTVRAQTPSPTAPASGAQVRRLIFVSAGFNESNRFWTVDRPSHLQFDPFLETLLDLDPKTGAFIPRLAEKWQASPDLKEWTFYLRKGVPFHFGFGEFTAREIDEGKLIGLWHDKATHCCIWSNIIGLRPPEEWVRVSYTSKGLAHHFEDEFIEKKYVELTQAVDAQERERIARAIGDHLFEEFADIPMGRFANELMANPKVVAEWLYPGAGAGRSTHFHMLKAAP